MSTTQPITIIHQMNYNPLIQPMNYTNTPTKYTDNQTDTNINPMNYTQTKCIGTQSNPIDLSTKHTYTHTPNENYTQTDMIPQSTKYTLSLIHI